MEIAAIASQVLDLMTPVLLAALAGALCQQVGLFNVALEGMMLVGAFSALACAALTGSTLLGILAATLFTTLFAAPMAAGVGRFKADPVVLGIGTNLLAAGLTSYLLSIMFGVRGTYMPAAVVPIPRMTLPFVAEIPFAGVILSGHDALVYLSWLGVALLRVFLYRTPLGLRLRGAGENSAASEAMGTKVGRYQAIAVLVGGTLCGLAGAELALGSITLFAEGMTAGRGWIAVVAVMLGRARPVGIFVSCLIFAAADAVGLRLQGQGLPSQLTDTAPYAITLLSLMALGARRVWPSAQPREPAVR